MNFKEENGVYSLTQTLIAKVVADKDQYLKDVIVEYAKNRSKELGKEIEVLFIDKTMADEIIDLGIRAYLLKERKK